MERKTSFAEAVRKHIGITITGLIVLAGIVAWSEYRYYELKKVVAVKQTDFTNQIASFTASSTEMQNVLATLMSKIDTLNNESIALTGVVQNEKSKNEVIQEQVGKVASTIGSLDKLSKTDPELLQKYSKVFFLNEHYTPPNLATVSSDFSLNKETKYQVHANIANNLDNMLKTAKSQGMNLLVASAYRSYGTQGSLKANYKVTYGAGTANKFSAEQGYSEHQLGTTLDFTTPKIGGVLTGFDTTPEFTWLVNNAHTYGFVMSYPKGNAYYIYEPWHWRYVGVDLASRLKREGKNFYDLDQRVIDEYLLLVF
ncbi:MAG: zinc D-Ala-D-Ala carboxypeptidase [Patescibacteria group bacterium]|nr:zinc D-Ala-D-Ala carboxypeptidase [Patescibacteria group bacterium]